MTLATDKDKLMKQFGFRNYLPGLKYFSAEAFFTVQDDEVDAAATVADLKALILARLQATLNFKSFNVPS